ncbi:MAG: NAD(P)/FAD-dependent oxidoreductase [Almyronema sp.]
MANSNPTVIIGGGFAGLFTALHLNQRQYPHPVVLIDPQSRFAFKPLLYEYLTGEMQPEQVLPRYTELLPDRGITFVQDQVTQVDLANQQVETATGRHFDYRYLVLAVGSTQGYFGTPGAKAHALAWRTQADTEALQHHLHDCLQKARQTAEAAERQKLLTVAVVGAGPAGVEAAATLADLLPQWYAALGGDRQDLRLVLINHGKEILAGDINSHLQEMALAALKQRTLAVELLLGVRVKSVSADQLTYQAGDAAEPQTLATATTLWTAGTATHPLLQTLALSDQQRDRHGLPIVSATLQIPDFPNVFAAGDCATVASKSLPAVAQVAYQQGAGVAQNLIALSEGRSPQPVTVNLRGTLMKLGIHNGVANLFNRVQVNGEVGDLIRNTTYLEMLPTPLHNFKVTSEWIEDRIFDRYHRPEAEASTANLSAAKAVWPWLVGGFTVAAGVILAIVLAQRSPQWPQPSAPSPQVTPQRDVDGNS